VKEAGRLQSILVFGLLAILIGYVFSGIGKINSSHFYPFFAQGVGPLFAVASLVFISYGGLTKVVALAEETINPGKNLPLGMIISLLVTSLLYASVIFVTIGVLEPRDLAGSLTPISDGAGAFGGPLIRGMIWVGALLAFLSTANSALMTASRYPLGMSRDKILPPLFQKISPKFSTPYISILFTGGFMLFAILTLGLELLVKVASSILLLLYIFTNLTLIIFRESKILSYRPKFYTPLYPYLQILGVGGGVFLLVEMGTLILFLTMMFLAGGFIWYKVYVEARTTQDSALIHLLERLVAKDESLARGDLLVELRDIVLEREGIKEDRFHSLIQQSQVLDIDGIVDFEVLFDEASRILSKEVNIPSTDLFRRFFEREKASSTVIREGLAIPHVVVPGKGISRILLARARKGVRFPEDKMVYVVFFLVSSVDERNFHLKILAAIAQVTQEPDFDKRWLEARGKEDLKNIILLAKRRRD
jgi:mannitol/fructose-specific phosphotransferase system IIA component (Ntr-type)